MRTTTDHALHGLASPFPALVLFVAAFSSGCTGMLRPAISPAFSPYIYQVGPEDSLKVEVYGEPAIERVVTVTPDGRISFPLVGDVNVLDLTIAQVADQIHDRLLKTIASPVVTVTLVESRSPQVQVVGEVAHQGAVPFRARLSLVQAIGRAGGVVWPYAKSEAVHIVRGPLVDPIRIAVDYEDVLDAKIPDVYLQPGDIVVVPPKWVTVFDRWFSQLLGPLGTVTGGATSIIKGGVP